MAKRRTLPYCIICSSRHRSGQHRVSISHLRPRRRSRAAARYWRGNPGRRRGGGSSGIGLMSVLLIGGAAYFLLLRPGGIGAMFGGAQPAVAGYTPIGGNYYRNQATGQTVYRNPSTGQMSTAAGGIAPSGVPAWLQPTVQAGAMAIPQLGIGLVQGLTSALTSGVRSLFGETSVLGTPTVAGAIEGGGATISAPDILRREYSVPTLPSEIAAPMPVVDWGQWFAEGGVASPEGAIPTYADIFAGEGGAVALNLPDYMPPEQWVTSLELAPVDTSGWWASNGSAYF